MAGHSRDIDNRLLALAERVLRESGGDRRRARAQFKGLALTEGLGVDALDYAARSFLGRAERSARGAHEAREAEIASSPSA